jgi:hypothetical protein
MRQPDRIVDFIYVGAPRAGSTWLSAVLADHPQIYIPPSKEIHFFNDRMPYTFEYRYPKGLQYYRSFFREARPDQILGDISPFYFLDPNAAWRIREHAPQAKLLCSLRDPADMLYSLYLLLRRRERRARTFEEEIAQHPQLLDLCRYHHLLQPYYDLFPPGQVFVMLYDSLREDPRGLLRSLYGFLGVDADFLPDSWNKRFNVATDRSPSLKTQSRGIVIRALNLPWLVGFKNLLVRRGMKDIRYYGEQNSGACMGYAKLSEATRKQLSAILRADLVRLEEMTGLDLSVWPTFGAPLLRTER